MEEAGLPKARRPFAIFVHERRDLFVGLAARDRFKIASKAWKDLPPEDRRPFEERSTKEFNERRARMRELVPRKQSKGRRGGGRAAVAAAASFDPLPRPRPPGGGDGGDPGAGIDMEDGPFIWSTGERSLLGSGSFGTVYRGYGQGYSRVAVKVFHTAQDRRHELRSMCLFDGALGPESPFPRVLGHTAAQGDRVGAIIMELFDETLSHLLQSDDGGFSRFAAVAIFHQIRTALKHMHGKGIAHLDVKPSNVLWLRVAGRAVLTDFSLAAEWAPGGTARTDHPHNSLPYRPPEQLRGRPPFPVLPETDVWAFGCTVWEIGFRDCAGRPSSERRRLFDGGCERAVQGSHAAYFAGGQARRYQAGFLSEAVEIFCHFLTTRRLLGSHLQRPELNETPRPFRGTVARDPCGQTQG